jgi:hypothetical protein
MALSLSRNATFICSYVDTVGGWDGAGRHPGDANTFEIGILDGFSFSQATGTQNVTLNEAGATPQRGQNIFNTSLEPVDWSFTTYVRPRIDDLTTDLHGMAEKILWNALVSSTKTNNTSTGGIASTASSCTVASTTSNVNQLLKLTGWFVFSDSSTSYKLSKMCVNSASIDFDIDGIAQITWSGYAAAITADAAKPDTAADGTDGYVANPAGADFILNRLSTVSLVSTISGGSKTYTFPLTGGNITIDNGISYVTPEELGVINTPIDHQTGTRAVSGNFTCYLDTSATGSKGVYNDILTDVNGAAPDVTNDFDITLKIGGASAPNLVFTMSDAHLELPSIDTADVMGATINFTALESAFGTGNNELSVVYTGSEIV